MQLSTDSEMVTFTINGSAHNVSGKYQNLTLSSLILCCRLLPDQPGHVYPGGGAAHWDQSLLRGGRVRGLRGDGEEGREDEVGELLPDPRQYLWRVGDHHGGGSGEQEPGLSSHPGESRR